MARSCESRFQPRHHDAFLLHIHPDGAAAFGAEHSYNAVFGGASLAEPQRKRRQQQEIHVFTLDGPPLYVERRRIWGPFVSLDCWTSDGQLILQNGDVMFCISSDREREHQVITKLQNLIKRILTMVNILTYNLQLLTATGLFAELTKCKASQRRLLDFSLWHSHFRPLQYVFAFIGVQLWFVHLGAADPKT